MTSTSTTTNGEPAIVTTGFQLAALLTICGHAVGALDNIPDGSYREKLTSALSNALELAETMSVDLLIHAEKNPGKAEPKEAA